MNTQNITAKYYAKLLEAWYLENTHFENVNTQLVIRTYTSVILLKKLWYSISHICSNACMEWKTLEL